MQQSEEFKKNVSELVNDFKTKGPFSSTINPNEVKRLWISKPVHFFYECLPDYFFFKALSIIDQMKATLAKLKEDEQELRRGLGIFKIDHPMSKDIQNLEKVKILLNYGK